MHRRASWPVLALAACAQSRTPALEGWTDGTLDDAFGLPYPAEAPPPVLVLSAPDALLMERDNALTVTGAIPGVSFGLVGSSSGVDGTACLPPIAPACLDLSSPSFVVGFGRTDATGTATFTARPPRTSWTGPVYLQAATRVPVVGAYLSNVVDLAVLPPEGDEDLDDLSNEDEIALHGTRWDDPDSDGGGLDDGTEVAQGTDPLDPSDDVPPPVRVTNPFLGAQPYVNPSWAQKVADSQALEPQLFDAFEVLREQPTAIWLDRIAAIDGDPGSLGLADHLDAALAQQTGTAPMLVVLVLYDLPDRDCAAGASSGELRLSQGGLATYQQDFIDRIATILDSEPAYRSLRVVTVLEPDSLPNLVTNLGIPACATAAPGYEAGLAYAISSLSQLEHVYVYLDVAHSGWLGWDHVPTAAAIYRSVMNQAGGTSLVSGFVSNVSNYSTLHENFDPYTDIQANLPLIEGFWEWNRVIDEQRFADRWLAEFPGLGFVVDTGRNGWAPRSNDRMDRRAHRGNWCNITDTGLGARFQAAPAPGLHATFWVKPPGESDGSSNPGSPRYAPACGSQPQVNGAGVPVPTNALQGAPEAGEWFHDHLVQLVELAQPPL